MESDNIKGNNLILKLQSYLALIKQKIEYCDRNKRENSTMNNIIREGIS